MKLSFSREEYLEHSEAFESDQILDAQNELTEFNEDVEDMAFELAYTRYALAKAEKRIEELEAKNANRNRFCRLYVVGIGFLD